jgi:DMSO reductase anchor subunit
MNFCTGGAGSMLYGLTFLLSPCVAGLLGFAHVTFVRLCCVFLVVLGFAAVGIEARKPMNARFLLHNLKRSWMSVEVLAGLLFLILASLDIVLSHTLLRFGALGMGMALCVCQAMMVYDAKGVEAWNTGLTAAHALSSSLVLACGFGLVLYSFCVSLDMRRIVLVVMVSLTVNLLLWLRLIHSKGRDDAWGAFRRLRTSRNHRVTIWTGQVLPGLMLLLVVGIEALWEGSLFSSWVFALAGGMIIIGGSYQKAAVILGANSLKAVRPGVPRPGRFIHTQ